MTSVLERLPFEDEDLALRYPHGTYWRVVPGQLAPGETCGFASVSVGTAASEVLAYQSPAEPEAKSVQAEVRLLQTEECNESNWGGPVIDSYRWCVVIKADQADRPK